MILLDIRMLRKDAFQCICYSSIHTNLNSKKDITAIKPENASKKIAVPAFGSAGFSALFVDEMEIHRTGSRIGNDMIVNSDPLPPAFAVMAARIVVAAAIDMPPDATDRMKYSG